MVQRFDSEFPRHNWVTCTESMEFGDVMILHDGCLHNRGVLGAPREPWISDSANITPEVVFVLQSS